MAEILEAKTRVDDLLFIANHLIDILKQENSALAQNQTDVVHKLLDQKTKLSRAYEIRVLGLEQSGQDLSEVDPILIEELKQQSNLLQELVETNARELKIKIDLGTLYMDVIADSVKTATPTTGSYSSHGNSAHDELSRKGKSAPIAIDEKL